MNEQTRPSPRIHASFVAERRRRARAYFEEKGLRPHYILEHRSEWSNNIILKRVADYVSNLKGERRSFPIHKYIHHGLSSQAFSWNLLGPLIVDKQWYIIGEILNEADIPFGEKIVSADMEVEDREVFNEDRGQPTSVDMCFGSSSGERVFIEFKYTEAEFGGCSVFREGDCDGRNPANNFDLCYLHSIGRKYWTLAKHYGLLSKQMRTDSLCPFSTLYQAYRLIMFTLVKCGHFLLLYDERNPTFVIEEDGINRGLFVRVLESLPESVRQRCHALSVQSVLKILESHEELDWLDELKSKYF